MLLQLTIRNFALIETLSLDFKSGFTILSGETGAGKSILIDAINYVLGGKFNKDLIRTGEKKAFVEAIYSIDKNDNLKEILHEYDIEYEETLILSRETFQNGKSITKINGKSVVLGTLKRISEKLLDIHGQHNNQNLLNKENHIIYLDSFGDKNLKKYCREYYINFQKLKDLKSKISELSLEGKNEKLINYIEYQLNEINEGNLKKGEEEELSHKYSILSNSEKIHKSLSISYNLLNSSTEENSILNLLDNIIRELGSIEKHSEKILKINENANNIYYELQEIAREIRDISEEVIYDDDELESINSRIYKIGLLKKKYGNSIDEIIKYKKDLEYQLHKSTHSEKIIKELKYEMKLIIDTLNDIALKIHKKREISAKNLEEKIQHELEYVGLGKCQFKISVELMDDFNYNGKNNVQFMISTNPGEPIKPMEKVVSGGELSRIMLALKTVFIDKDKVPTVIFDEIDTGISGRVAQSVAEKMYEISTRHQVFCITHLPQIASMSDNHYIVRKNVENEKTFTTVEQICQKQKIKEVGKMLGGVELTHNTLMNAKDMINLANEKKQGIRQMYT